MFLPGDLACDILMCGVVQGQLSVFTDNENNIYFDILKGYWKFVFFTVISILDLWCIIF